MHIFWEITTIYSVSKTQLVKRIFFLMLDDE